MTTRLSLPSRRWSPRVSGPPRSRTHGACTSPLSEALRDGRSACRLSWFVLIGTVLSVRRWFFALCPCPWTLMRTRHGLLAKSKFVGCPQHPFSGPTTANDQKLSAPTASVAWTRVLLTRCTVHGTCGKMWCAILKTKGQTMLQRRSLSAGRFPCLWPCLRGMRVV